MKTRILLLAVAAVLVAAGVWLGVATTDGPLNHAKPAYGGWGECGRQLPRPDVLPAQGPAVCQIVGPQHSAYVTIGPATPVPASSS